MDTGEENRILEKNEAASSGTVAPETAGVSTEDVVRLQAEFANLRKAAAAEANAVAKRVIADAVRAIAPPLDALRLAVREASAGRRDRFLEGFQKVYDQFEQSLTSIGVVPVPAEGAYDPKFHEAIERVPGEEYRIVEEVGRGWMFKEEERVIVPAKVKVGAG